MKSGNKDADRERARQPGQGLQRVQATASHAAEQKQKCANKTAALVDRDRDGVAPRGRRLAAAQRGTGDQKTMALAAQLYKKVVDNWNAGASSRSSSSRASSRKTGRRIYKIKYAMADLLYFQKDWAKCGPAFDAVVAENPQAPEAAEAAYAAVLCYQNIYDETHKGGADKKGAGNLPGQEARRATRRRRPSEAEKLKPKDMTDNQKGMVTAFNRYICYIKPAAERQRRPGAARRGQVRARAHLLRGAALGGGGARLPRHRAQQRRPVTSASTPRSSTSSAQRPRRALRSAEARVLRRHGAGRPEVHRALLRRATRRRRTPSSARSLTKIQVRHPAPQGAEARRARRQGRRQGARALREGRQRRTSRCWRKYCEDAAAQRTSRRSARSATRSSTTRRAPSRPRASSRRRSRRADRSSTRRYSDGQHASSPRRRSTRSAVTTRPSRSTTRRPTGTRSTRRTNPKATNADKALSDAVVLRLGLGQEDQAIEDARRFNEELRQHEAGADGRDRLRDRRPLRRARGLGQGARSALPGAMGIIDKAAPTFDVVSRRTRSLGASTLSSTKQREQAKAEYAKVRALWSDPAAAEAKIKTRTRARTTRSTIRRLGKALNAVGEAFFFVAEEKRKPTSIRSSSPTTRARATRTTCQAHQDQGRGLVSRRSAPAIEKVEPEYIKILELKPVPPPKWVIAAGSRVGSHVGRLRRRLPRARRSRGRGRRTPSSAAPTTTRLDEASEPFKVSKRARPALKTCLDYSVKYQYFDEFSRNCEVWLAKNYKAEYHVVDELRGVADALEQRPRRAAAAAQHRRRAVQAPAAALRPPPTRRRTPATSDKGDKPTSRKKRRRQAASTPQEGPEARCLAGRRSERSMRMKTITLRRVLRCLVSARRAAAAAPRAGGQDRPAADGEQPGGATTPVARGRASKFNAALDAFVEHDKANDWNDATCADVAKLFLRRPRRRSRASELPRGDLQRGPRVPALQQGQGGEGAVRAGARRRPEVPPRPRRSSRSTSHRAGRDGHRRGDRRARSRP